MNKKHQHFWLEAVILCIIVTIIITIAYFENRINIIWNGGIDIEENVVDWTRNITAIIHDSYRQCNEWQVNSSNIFGNNIYRSQIENIDAYNLLMRQLNISIGFETSLATYTNDTSWIEIYNTTNMKVLQIINLTQDECIQEIIVGS